MQRLLIDLPSLVALSRRRGDKDITCCQGGKTHTSASRT